MNEGLRREFFKCFGGRPLSYHDRMQCTAPCCRFFQAYVGKPVQCWCPAQFTGGWEQYVEDYCFVENTYYLPFEKRIPTDTDYRDKQMLNYYQVAKHM